MVVEQPTFPLLLNNFPTFMKPNVPHPVRKHKDLTHILGTINPLNYFLPHLFEIHFNIMPHPYQRLLIGLLYANSPAGFSTQLSVPTNTTVASHIIIIISSSIMSSVLRQPLPKPVLHTVRSCASSFNFKCLLVFLRASRSCLCLLLLLRVLIPSTFHSIPCFRSHFLNNM